MNARAVVLAAHGSRHEPQVNERIRRLADGLAARTDYTTVAVAFHQGSPEFAEVLDTLAESAVSVVPLMTSRGYYSDYVLPRELARNRRGAEVSLRITSPVGTHPGMIEIARRRVEALCTQFELNPEHCTVAVVGHGTKRHERSRRATVNLASQLGYSKCCGQAFAVFLDDEPGVEAASERAACDDVIVLPFLIGAGAHAASDIPARLGFASDAQELPREETVSGRRIVVDRPLGEDEAILDIIVDLASDEPRDLSAARPRRPVAIGTRCSRLALWQTEHVASRLRENVELRAVEISTLGDRVQQCPLPELPGAAPFCDDIENALSAGLIDLAVHSLKDLALHPPREFEIAAVLARGDAREALVACGGHTLDCLPAGAVVGTCSPRRSAQLLALRPDLSVQPIRGAVDERVAQVRQGRFDAAVLAVAGLQRLGLESAATEVFPIDRFVPAPAQAALAVEVRAGDELAQALARRLDDNATRIATTLELNILRALEPQGLAAIAAHARVGDDIELMVRIIAYDGTRTGDIVERGARPGAVQRAALARAERVLAEFSAEVHA
jgi:hydroxymethylbilane synthase